MRNRKRQEKNRNKKEGKEGILEKDSSREYYLHETNEKNARRKRKL